MERLAMSVLQRYMPVIERRLALVRGVLFNTLLHGTLASIVRKCLAHVLSSQSIVSESG
jgi:hypothetical protein